MLRTVEVLTIVLDSRVHPFERHWNNYLLAAAEQRGRYVRTYEHLEQIRYDIKGFSGFSKLNTKKFREVHHI